MPAPNFRVRSRTTGKNAPVAKIAQAAVSGLERELRKLPGGPHVDPSLAEAAVDLCRQRAREKLVRVRPRAKSEWIDNQLVQIVDAMNPIFAKHFETDTAPHTEHRTTSPTKKRTVPFTHRFDYSTVEWRKKPCTLGKNQRVAFELLHDAHRRGEPGIRAGDIVQEMGDGPDNMRDCFKGSPLMGTLIVRGARGLYRLKTEARCVSRSCRKPK